MVAPVGKIVVGFFVCIRRWNYNHARYSAVLHIVFKDVESGIRVEDVIERSVTRIPLYDTLKTVKIDTNEKTVAMIANEIQQL